MPRPETPAAYTRRSSYRPWIVRCLIQAGRLRIDHAGGRTTLIDTQEPPRKPGFRGRLAKSSLRTS